LSWSRPRSEVGAGSGSESGGKADESDASHSLEGENVPEDKLLPAIAVKFLSESGYCGDTVQNQMTGENLPAKPAARIDFKSGTDGSVVETHNGTMDPMPYKPKWIARKKGAEWGNPEVLLSAEAAGAKAEGENKFKLKRLPDFAKETKTIACTSGIFGWTGKFDIEFKAGILHVTTKVRLINRLGAKPAPGDPMPAAGDPVTAEDKADIKKDVESKLTGKWFLHRNPTGPGSRPATTVGPMKPATCWPGSMNMSEEPWEPRRAGKRPTIPRSCPPASRCHSNTTGTSGIG
jgi:hypothetical protein